MKTKLSSILTLILALVVQISFAQGQTVTGTVTDSDGLPLPGVNVVIKGTTTGAQTDFDGHYSIPAVKGDVLVFSFVGLKTAEYTVGNSNTIAVTMKPDSAQLDEVVVTALGIKRETKTLTYATQQVDSKELNITQNNDIKNALAGKVAGVQLNGSAGSQLNGTSKIRIRGAISLTSDNDALYVVDGVPGVDPSSIDMENVATINVLKGPNATALYGQRADSGVIEITTKKGSGNMAVEFASSAIFDNVAYLPKYQNLYGGGYEGDASFGIFGDESTGSLSLDSYPQMWQQFAGQRYLLWDNNYADESWGPKFDGQDYVPWYAWWPDSPYYGQTAKYTAQPDNIKNYYNTGVTLKNSISVSGGDDKFSGRISYTNLDQKGIQPYSDLQKNFITTNFEFNASDKLKLTSTINYTQTEINGNFDNGYSNQGSGSFNSWFNRNLDTGKLRELRNLLTPNGYSASWNWWGPDYYLYGGGYQKPAFWFNQYFWFENDKRRREYNTLVGSLNATYDFNDNWQFSATATRNQEYFNYSFHRPYIISYSAASDLYNPRQNAFGIFKQQKYENNFSALLKYQNDWGDFDVSAFVGGNVRRNGLEQFSAEMDPDAASGGLIIPNLYNFANAGEIPTPVTYYSDKQVNSLYGKASVGYKGLAYLDATYRKDWSSALPKDRNGYGYPSIGGSFIFSQLLDSNVLSFGKLRAGWAQVGSDVSALLINQIYNIAAKPYQASTVLQYTPTTIVDPNLKPALNTSFEVGADLKFFSNRIGLSATYYDETRKDEIISLSVPRGTGYNSFLTNAGETERKGIELTLNADIFQNPDGFSWSTVLNFAHNRTVVNKLPNDLQETAAPGGTSAFGVVTMKQNLGEEWGQLQGIGIKKDANGNPVLQSNGLYTIQPGQYFGSVLPDFTGGFINTFSYKNLSLTASIDFQKGGHFFSLSEFWGESSGLLAETAAINDKGNNVRDAVADGGGVHSVGVDANGNPVDTYVDAHTWFTQGSANYLAEPYIHGASYVKLRDVSLTYNLPSKLVDGIFQSASISAVGRNLWLIAVSKDNYHRWDPSELSETYGENGQLPGTRSFGVNIKLTF